MNFHLKEKKGFSKDEALLRWISLPIDCFYRCECLLAGIANVYMYPPVLCKHMRSMLQYWQSNSCSAKAQLVDERLVAGGWLRFQNSGSGSCCKSLKARFSLGDRHRLPGIAVCNLQCHTSAIGLTFHGWRIVKFRGGNWPCKNLMARFSL